MTNTPQGAPAPDYGQNTPGQNQPGQPGSKYGTAAYNPQQSFEQGKPAKAGTLRSMTLASLALFLVSIALSVGVLFTEPMREVMRTEIEAQGAVPGGTSADDLIAISIASAAVVFGIIAVVGIIIYVLVLLGVSRRWGWARIVGIIAAIIGVLFSLYTVITGLMTGIPEGLGALTIISWIVTLLFLVVNIYWLVLAFNGKVAAWFKGAR